VQEYQDVRQQDARNENHGHRYEFITGEGKPGCHAGFVMLPDLTLAMLTDGCRLCAEYIDRRLVNEESPPACAMQGAAVDNLWLGRRCDA